jgi:mRNA-degrading endonuclease RelE of RelBE toxin-antitoxin system
MPWRLSIAPRAEKDLLGLPQRDRESVIQALSRLTSDPGSVDLRKLTGRRDEWRLRVGRWRAILHLDSSTSTIQLLRVLSRGRAYRD